MATYAEQITATQSAHMISRALSDAAVKQLADLFDKLTMDEISLNQYSISSKRVIRTAYRESAKAGRSLVRHLSGMDDWEPEPALTVTPYLNSLLADVEANVANFGEGVEQRDGSSMRQLKLRVSLSAITAAERGFTDAQLEHYSELEDFGYSLQKMWLANFINNEPCADCINLNGNVVSFRSEFPVPTLMRTAIYRDLQGPPLHVRCKCVMVVLITTAENMFDRVPNMRTTPANTMTTETVKKLPRRIFNTLIKFLKAITGRGDNND